jgi:hypothetical protein
MCCYLQTGDWVVLLEGICRISITGLADVYGSVHGSSHGVHGSSKADVAGAGPSDKPTQAAYDVVTIQQLELLPHVPFGSNGSSNGSNGVRQPTPFSSSSSIGGTVTPPFSSSGHPGSIPGPLTLRDPAQLGLRNPGGAGDGLNGGSSGGSNGSRGSTPEDIEQLGAALKASTKVMIALGYVHVGLHLYLLCVSAAGVWCSGLV